jgi:hypothetical protein
MNLKSLIWRPNPPARNSISVQTACRIFMKFGEEVNYKTFSNKCEYREFRISENTLFKGDNALLSASSVLFDLVG